MIELVVTVTRTSDAKLPLFLHIAGAMTLVGGLALALIALMASWRGGEAVMSVRLGYRALLLAALPGWIVMRIAAEWVASKEGFDKNPPSWVNIGFSTAEPGLLLIIIATVLAGLAARKGTAGTGVRVAAVLVSVLVVIYLVAIWAMTTKPV